MNQLNETKIRIQITEGQINNAKECIDQVQERLMRAPREQWASIRLHLDCLVSDLRELELTLEVLHCREARLEMNSAPDVELIEQAINEAPNNQPLGSTRTFMLMSAMKRTCTDCMINRVHTDNHKYETYRIYVEDEGDLALTVTYDRFNLIASGVVSWFPLEWTTPKIKTPKTLQDYRREAYAIAGELDISTKLIHPDLKPAFNVTSSKHMTVGQMRHVRDCYRCALNLVAGCDNTWPHSGRAILERIAENRGVELHQLHRLKPQDFYFEPSARWIEHALGLNAA